MIKDIFGYNYSVDNGNSITIGGVRSVKTFLPELIIVNIAHGNIEIAGKEFKIEYFSDGEIKICGVIGGIIHNIKGSKHEKLGK